MQRLIKAVAVGYLGNHLRVQPAPAAIVPIADVADPGTRMAGGHAAISGAGQAAAVAELNRRNRLIDRTAGRDLHNKKVNGDNRPQGGDDEQ